MSESTHTTFNFMDVEPPTPPLPADAMLDAGHTIDAGADIAAMNLLLLSVARRLRDVEEKVARFENLQTSKKKK